MSVINVYGPRGSKILRGFLKNKPVCFADPAKHFKRRHLRVIITSIEWSDYGDYNKRWILKGPIVNLTRIPIGCEISYSLTKGAGIMQTFEGL